MIQMSKPKSFQTKKTNLRILMINSLKSANNADQIEPKNQRKKTLQIFFRFQLKKMMKFDAKKMKKIQQN